MQDCTFAKLRDTDFLKKRAPFTNTRGVVGDGTQAASSPVCMGYRRSLASPEAAALTCGHRGRPFTTRSCHVMVASAAQVKSEGKRPCECCEPSVCSPCCCRQPRG